MKNFNSKRYIHYNVDSSSIYNQDMESNLNVYEWVKMGE